MKTNVARRRHFAPKSQFSFRSKRNCSHAMAEVIDYIRKEIDKKGSGNVCLTDLKKLLIR